MNDIYEIDVFREEADEWETVATAPGFVGAVAQLIDQRMGSGAMVRLVIR